MSYSEKLKDPRWQKKRLEIFQRDNWKCSICPNGLEDGYQLHIHHLKYSGEPWDIEDKYLQTLCSKCHKKEHFDKFPEPETTFLDDSFKEIKKTDPELIFESVLIDSGFRFQAIKHHYLAILHWIESQGDDETLTLAKNDLSDFCYRSKYILVCINGDVYGEQNIVVRHG